MGTVLMRRETLVVFHACYAFVQACYLDRTVLWDTARDELAAFQGCMAFLVSSWCLRWSPQVYSTDASLSGWCVSTSWWPSEVVKSTGRRRERGRFRAMPGTSARASALAAAGLEEMILSDLPRWRGEQPLSPSTLKEPCDSLEIDRTLSRCQRST